MDRKERFHKAYDFLRQKGRIHTQTDLAKEIGSSRSNASAAYNGDPKFLTDNFLRRFNEAFGNVFSLQWLILGEGDMLLTPENDPSEHTGIRYWVDIDATGGGIELFNDRDTKRFIDISIPEFKDCTDAVNLYGDSMSPLYKNGQIIILKKWTERFIDYGNVYLIITREGNRMVKYLRQGSDNSRVLCVSENKDFDPFEIEKDDILTLFLVKGAISKNTM